MSKTHIVKHEEGQTEKAVQLRASDPGSPTANQTWINSSEKKLKFYDGASTLEIGGSGEWTGNVAYDVDGVMDTLTGVSSFTVSGGTRVLTTTVGEVGRGIQALKWTPGAASQTLTKSNFTLPLGYRKFGKLTFSGLIKCSSNVTVILRDVTNSVDIINQVITAPSDFTKFEFTASHASSTATLYWQVVSSSTNVILIDDIYVGPSLSLTVDNFANVTEWVEYTPTLGGITVGNGSSKGLYRRVGDTIQISYTLELGSTTSISGNIEVSPPSGLSIDTSKITFGQNARVGTASFSDASNGASEDWGHIFVHSSTVFRMFQNGSGVGSTQPFTWTTSDRLAMTMYAPIVGWSATTEHVVTSSDSVAPAIYETAAGQTIPTGVDTVVDFATKVIDNDASVTTGGSWKFTASKAMVVSVSAYLNFSSSAANYTSQIQLYKNGSIYRSSRIGSKNVDTDSDEVNIHISTNVSLAKGDYIDIRAFQNTGGNLTLQANASRNHISVHRIDRTPLIAAPLRDTQYNLTTTTDGTGWSPSRAIGIPYQIADGSWRLKFTVTGTHSVDIQLIQLNITGVVFKNVSGYNQAVALSTASGSKFGYQAFAIPNTNTVSVKYNTTSGDLAINGDVELNSKPTFVP